MQKLYFSLILSALFIAQINAACNVCNSNGVACISATEFNVCKDGIPDNSTAFKCQGENEVCTKLSAICIDNSAMPTLKLGCGDTSNCGKCEGRLNGVYTCTSQTTFTMCHDDQLSNVRVTCPKGYVCDVDIAVEGTYPCVPECKKPTNVCDLVKAIDAPEDEENPDTTTEINTTTTTGSGSSEVTTTEDTPTDVTPTKDTPTETTPTKDTPTETTPTKDTPTETTPTKDTPTETTPTKDTPTETTPTKDTPTDEPATTTTTVIISPTPPETTTTDEPITTTTQDPTAAVCPEQNKVGRFVNPSDSTCTTYVYCFFKGGAITGVVYDCQPNKFFDPSVGQCTTEKPVGCI